MNKQPFSTPESGLEEDHALMAAIAEGDEQAFRQLYARFSTPLFSLISKMLHSPHDAEEVLQAAFVQVWKRAGTFDSGRCAPFTWLVMITRGRAIDRLRQQQRYGRLIVGAEAQPEVRGAAASPDERIALRESGEAIKAALCTIPADQRQAIEMAFFQGLSQAEISEKLSEPLGTIKARIRRGLLRLREGMHRHL